MTPESKFAFVWPKDPRPGNPSRWPFGRRFLDVLTNKGPDIFIVKYTDRASFRRAVAETNWSRWNFDGPNHHQHGCQAEKRTKYSTVIPLVERRPEERYDFRTRKYVIPGPGTWSAVQYCDNPKHTVPRRYWDWNGDRYEADYWHDVIHGAHEDSAPMNVESDL